MRHIDFGKLQLLDEWHTLVAGYLVELRNMEADDRAEALGKASFSVWRMIVPLLRRISHNKCYYSERLLNFGVTDVDHFRPKNRVAKCDLPDGETHRGYWWLSLFASNFRLSAPQCNRLTEDAIVDIVSGKGTRFPVSGVRAVAEGDSLEAENALLLDPLVATDPPLLKFDDLGQVDAAAEDENSADYRRAKLSIRIYNLDNGELANLRGHYCARAKHLAQTLEELLEKEALTLSQRRQLVETMIQLKELVRDDAEFVTAVRTTLRAFNYIPFIAESLEEWE